MNSALSGRVGAISNFTTLIKPRFAPLWLRKPYTLAVKASNDNGNYRPRLVCFFFF